MSSSVVFLASWTIFFFLFPCNFGDIGEADGDVSMTSSLFTGRLMAGGLLFYINIKPIFDYNGFKQSKIKDQRLVALVSTWANCYWDTV